MTDYDLEGLGDYGRGKMKLRDNGSTIEFFVYVGWSTTNWGSVGWSYSSPNGSGSGSFGYPGGMVWVKVGQITTTSSGNVSWTVNNTGTSEFRGPHTQTVYIGRATVPPAPTKPVIDQIKHDSVRVKFSGNGDGGSGILEWQIHYGISVAGGGVASIGSSGTTTINVTVPNFPPGGTLVAWARGRNAVGWGPFSSPSDVATLLPGIRIKVGGVWKNAIPYVKVAGAWVPVVVYVRKAGVWTITN